MHVATLRVGRLPIAIAFVFSLLRVSSAYADTITLMWDPNTEPVTGYAVYVGSQRVDVGNATSYTLGTATAGQQYCFAVAAYNANGEGPRSGQLCGYSNRFPALTNPGNRSATQGQATSLQLSGSDPEGQPISYIATGLPPGLFIGSATGFISGTPTSAGTYTVTASVYDGVLNSPSQNFTWTVTAASTGDTTAPSVVIRTPTAEGVYTSTTTNLSLSGTASDNVGVTSVNWVNNRGGSGIATGTTSWSVPSVGLQTGSNVITITARDAAGNVGTDILTVTSTAPDTTAPSVTITAPTTSGSYATSSPTLSISGTASDNVGVTAVTWATDRGSAGTASGTTSWTASAIALQGGANVVTVTARDAAGNLGRAVLTVTYTPPDTIPPTITILGPTSQPSYTTTSSVVTLGGTSSDNRGVTAVTWANNRGGSGFSSGTTNWSVPSVPLQGGSNVITMTAQDAAGNKGTAVLTVNRTVSEPTPPTVSITGPTSANTYATTTPNLTIGGTASAAAGVTQVTWQNSLSGAFGTAAGTTNWSAGMTLSVGTNVITVKAVDGVGNQATDVLTVTYTAPPPPPAPPPPAPNPSLTLSGRLSTSGRWVKAYLQWSSVEGRYIDVYLNGSRVDRTANDGSTTDTPRSSGPITYRVCVTGTTVCSNTLTLR
jgi:hypothetical protein